MKTTASQATPLQRFRKSHSVRREGEAPAEPRAARRSRLGGSLALPFGRYTRSENALIHASPSAFTIGFAAKHVCLGAARQGRIAMSQIPPAYPQNVNQNVDA